MTITVNDVLTALQNFAPEYMKENWDNVGLLAGDPAREVNRVYVCLDPFLEEIQNAVRLGADLMVCHHPLFFEIKNLRTDTETGACAELLFQKGLAEISMHTNLDAAPGGVNSVLAERLGLKHVDLLEKSRPEDTWGIGRVGFTEAEYTAEEFAQFVKQQLHCPGVRYVDGKKPVHKVAVGGGSCSSMLPLVKALECDTFVTADCKYNGFHDAEYLGITLIDAGHFYTENPVCASVARRLESTFPNLEVILSGRSSDRVHFL